jgi:hypothetical protein
VKDERNPGKWGRKPATKENVVPLAESHGNDGWGKKNPPEEMKSSPQKTSDDIDAMLAARCADTFILPHHDRHRNDPPRWYLKISREPCQVNEQNEAVGLGSFFKRVPYDYTDEELNRPQGHVDRIRTVDLTPEDRKRSEDADDDSVLPTDWLERMAELHHAGLDHCFGPGTWKCLMMGDLLTQYSSFYTNAERQFGNWHIEMNCAHKLVTDKKVQALQEMNAKRNLSANAGVEQLKKERAAEFRANVANLLDRFKAKSRRWTARNCSE